MLDAADLRGKLIRHLEDALALADELNDGNSGFLSSVHWTMHERNNSSLSFAKHEHQGEFGPAGPRQDYSLCAPSSGVPS